MVKVCHITEMEPADSQIFKTEIGQIAVFKTRNNKYFATAARCPHKGGPIAHGMYDGKKHITCPLHGYTFNVEDGTCSDETLKRSLKIFKIEVQDDYLYISKTDSKVEILNLESAS